MLGHMVTLMCWGAMKGFFTLGEAIRQLTSALVGQEVTDTPPEVGDSSRGKMSGGNLPDTTTVTDGP